MDRKLLLIGGVAAAGLLLLSSRASAKKPPALPSPAPRAVPPVSVQKPKDMAKVTSPAPNKVQISPTDDQARGAAAAAAAAASAISPPMTEPASQPAESPLQSVPAAQPSSSSQPSKPQLPEGYDPSAARRGAAAMGNHLKRSGRTNYDHRLLKDWQRKAGLAADGTYGGATRGALIYFGVANPPAPFFKPTNTIPYTPPG